MQKLKFLGVLTAAILAILCAVLIVVWLTVNPNNYKGKIAALVKEHTGRELKVTGDIKLSVFRWVAFELGPATLGNPAGFSDEPFLPLNHASLRVKLLSLLQKRLEVARVAIDGLDLRLAKNAQGRSNWLGAESPAQAPKPADGTTARYWEGLANVRVRNGHVSFEGVTLSAIDCETGSVGANHEIPVSLSLDARAARTCHPRQSTLGCWPPFSKAPARSTEIPLKITGTYVDPTVRPDVKAVAKEQLKQKLQDVRKKNGLEGLFKR